MCQESKILPVPPYKCYHTLCYEGNNSACLKWLINNGIKSVLSMLKYSSSQNNLITRKAGNSLLSVHWALQFFIGVLLIHNWNKYTGQMMCWSDIGSICFNGKSLHSTFHRERPPMTHTLLGHDSKLWWSDFFIKWYFIHLLRIKILWGQLIL